MTITGELFLGARRVARDATFQAYDPTAGALFGEAFSKGTKADAEEACTRAAEAAPVYAALSPEKRAAFLEAIADEIEALGDTLIERGTRETGLPAARLTGERGRTAGQLRLFAKEVRDGAWATLRIEHADPARQPLPKPDLRLRSIPVGPVVVFGASNFPLAFSVAGGDTASALAAGCPVVVKAHSAHPGTVRTGRRRDRPRGGEDGHARRRVLAGFRLGAGGRHRAGSPIRASPRSASRLAFGRYRADEGRC